ncbi:TRAP transporter small permease [Rhodoferax sp.]|uniref:TRAP transporter small permease n=1 Tax=Rhodoferax sp. TaxID=50421 RepID=UPI0025F3BC2F|nr:TRAP transporter small permease [Rhodoferax sp.]MCM2296190.1 TRAP transporter small permease [Rhodoferax sp.]
MVQKLIGRYCQLMTMIIVICLGVMVLMVFGNVVMRYAFNSGIAVSEELSRWLFLWLIFLGASIAVHEQAHMGSDMVLELLPAKLQKVAVVVGQLLMLWATWLIFSGSLAQTKINWDVQAPVTEYSMAWVYSTGVVFAVSTGLMLLSDMWFTLRGQLTPVQLRKAHHAAELAQFEVEARAAEAQNAKSTSTH